MHGGSMTTSWKWLIGLLMLVVSFWSGWKVNGWRYEKAQAVDKAETVQANADHFRDATKMINTEATMYKSNSNEMYEEIVQLKKELSNAQKSNPLSTDCKPDANRLRVVKDAVTSANAAARQ